MAMPISLGTAGHGLQLQVHPASVQDRDGAPPGLKASRAHSRFIQKVFADSALPTPAPSSWRSCSSERVQIVWRPSARTAGLAGTKR